MKLVINKCFGGFGLSAAAVARFAERKGRKCYFYQPIDSGSMLGAFERVDISAIRPGRVSMWTAMDIPDAVERGLFNTSKQWHTMTDEQKVAHNVTWDEHSFDNGREIKRDDPDLVAVVEELGAAANGGFANLEVVEIPDDVEWEISEYDGREHVAEQHRTWA